MVGFVLVLVAVACSFFVVAAVAWPLLLLLVHALLIHAPLAVAGRAVFAFFSFFVRCGEQAPRKSMSGTGQSCTRAGQHSSPIHHPAKQQYTRYDGT